jgi:hypothetical protein
MYKKMKNTDKPKGVRPACKFYLKENRGRIREDNKDANAAQVRKISSEEWAALDEMDRKQCEDKNAEDKKRYKREMEAYNKDKGTYSVSG